MLGLVYADYLDPAIGDIFHRAACDSFRNLSKEYADEILALTDPNVTSYRLWELFRKCDFIFYWGHGQRNTEDGPIATGSSQSEYVSVRRIGHEFKSKQFFLDACSVASELDHTR